MVPDWSSIWSTLQPSGIIPEIFNERYQMFTKTSVGRSGAAEGTRTPDPIITNDVLYQLSYSGILLAAAIQARGGLGKMENAGGFH